MLKPIGIEEMNVYVNLYEEIRARVDRDETAVGILAIICKDQRVKRMMVQRNEGDKVTYVSNPNEPATAKQLNYLKNILGVTVPENATKEQASELIEKAKAREAAQ